MFLRKPTGGLALSIVALVLVSVLGLGNAQPNRSPKGTHYYIFAPYHFQFDGGEDSFANNMEDQGYLVGFDILEGNDRTDPICRLNEEGTVYDFVGIIQQQAGSAGVILITSHGGYGYLNGLPTAKIAVEVYGEGQSGYMNMWAPLQNYWKSQDQGGFGYNPDFVFS